MATAVGCCIKFKIPLCSKPSKLLTETHPMPLILDALNVCALWRLKKRAGNGGGVQTGCDGGGGPQSGLTSCAASPLPAISPPPALPGTRALLEAIRLSGLRPRVLLGSSSAVYGRGPGRPTGDPFGRGRFFIFIWTSGVKRIWTCVYCIVFTESLSHTQQTHIPHNTYHSLNWTLP